MIGPTIGVTHITWLGRHGCDPSSTHRPIMVSPISDDWADSWSMMGLPISHGWAHISYPLSDGWADTSVTHLQCIGPSWHYPSQMTGPTVG
jgi:hypothetical protein